MKVATHTAARIHTYTPYERPPLPRRHSAPERQDAFQRRNGQHPRRTAHAHGPRPMRPSRPRSRSAEAIAGTFTDTAQPPCASLIGAHVSAPLSEQVETFSQRALAVTLTFAEWLLDVIAQVAMAYVSHRAGLPIAGAIGGALFTHKKI